MQNELRNAIKLQVSAQEMCIRPFKTTAITNKAQHSMKFLDLMQREEISLMGPGAF